FVAYAANLTLRSERLSIHLFSDARLFRESLKTGCQDHKWFADDEVPNTFPHVPAVASTAKQQTRNRGIGSIAPRRAVHPRSGRTCTPRASATSAPKAN